MAIRTVTNAQIILNTTDISGFVGTISDVPGGITVHETPNFAGGGFMGRVAGIKSGTFSVDGYADQAVTTGINSIFTPANLGSSYSASAAIPAATSVATGDKAMFCTGILSRYDGMNASTDTVMPTMLELVTSGAFVASGRVGAPLASYTNAGYTGAAVALTGPTATQSLYAILHVTAAAGTDLAVKIQSDDNSGFTSATDRITFSTVSAVGVQTGSVAGNLSTESHWRVIATIASSTFSFACYFGIA